MAWLLRAPSADLDFDAIRVEFELPAAFPPEVEDEAAAAEDRFASQRVDARELELVTIDPPGSLDLDQALHLERLPEGFRLSYAIADLGAWVAPGGAVDAEARRRGETIYLPDGTVPLHPRVLSEDRASLVAGQDRPAVLWEMETDARGTLTRIRVRRALVRSRARLNYAQVQQAADAGTALPGGIDVLREFGRLRAERARERGAIELRLPEQEVQRSTDGAWQLALEARTEADAWNSECSLITGIAAAALMVAGGIGLLRTLPKPDEKTVETFVLAARALGVAAPAGASCGEILASADAQAPGAMALNAAATKLLRGSGYLAFSEGEADGDADARWHASVAAEYAHVTAPIRRLGDRFAAEVALAIGGGEWHEVDALAPGSLADRPASVPAWASEALPELPGLLAASGHLAGNVENACFNLAEATVLAPRVGESFEAALLRPGDGRHDAEVFVLEPPTIAQCKSAEEVPAAEPVQVRLLEADPATRKVRFGYPADATFES